MTGAIEAGIAAVLRALPEPALVVEPDGRIVLANAAAAACFGPDLAGSGQGGGALAALCPEDDPAVLERLRAYLDRCAGTRAPLPGGLALRRADGAVTRFRCSGALVVPPSPEGGTRPRLLLRLVPSGDERFAALASQLRALHAEIRARRRIQAALEEALRERETLVRELHHRVKNSLHMLSGMLGAARRDAQAAETKAILAEVENRLAAIGTVHQMLYGAGSLVAVRADEVVTALCPLVLRALGADRRRVEVEAAPLEVPNDVAVPLALILNELLTNALKHGGGGVTPGGVRVRLVLPDGDGGGLALVVEDDGPGFAPAVAAGRRASGLGLVHGLVRQLGGSFVVEFRSGSTGGGARCVVRLGARRMR
ncbi:sensor histidine kinase [Caldovatus aquaticus]|uniref:histidine kinase n=1 Tax=Caldovatus aquaticus TaxID=2865671 RepID=A0ABS7F0B1_9PROT|nr:sensor histidine kinase [Caldovatus aquaticus]MBW8268994.1 sensor histidine kinase [Caldovatus aquaticus]